MMMEGFANPFCRGVNIVGTGIVLAVSGLFAVTAALNLVYFVLSNCLVSVFFIWAVKIPGVDSALDGDALRPPNS